MMISLLLDSSSTRLFVALARNGQVLQIIDELAFQTQSEIMTERINTLLQNNTLTAKDINEIIVARGPGSFTGVRIAVSISKVMAYALRVPLYAVSSLAVFKDETARTICVIDARRERSFAGIYEDNDIIMADTIMTNEEVLHRAQTEHLLISGETKHLGVKSIAFNRFTNMMKLKNEGNLVQDIFGFKPVYLKG